DAAAEIAEGSGGRQEERLRVVPLALIAGHDRAGEGGVQRRQVGIARVAVARAVGADLRREREAGLESRDGVELPVAPHLIASDGEFVEQRDIRLLRDVE